MWRVILIVSWATLALCVTRQGLFPFGDNQGDKRLPVGDDISSEEIQLKTPVAFYDSLYNSIFVNLNGHVSFETEIPAHKSDLIIPVFRFKLIAPFLADADSRLSGNVYYRESMDPALLNLARTEITRNWPSRRNFIPTQLFIVTWEEVGYFDRQYDKVNTFQLVLANSGAESYALLHYTEDGIQWIRGQGKARPVTNDVPAQAGFNAGDDVRYTTLPGSGSENIKDLSILSNVAIPGVWVYRIGLTSGGNVEGPRAVPRIPVVKTTREGSVANVLPPSLEMENTA
jgi:nidogen (entactin)